MNRNIIGTVDGRGPLTRANVVHAYLTEPVNYGGEIVTRAERRRRLLSAGLSHIEADRYEQGSDLGARIARNHGHEAEGLNR